jgi:hypothetical protein
VKFFKRITIEKHTPIQTKKEIKPRTARMFFWGTIVVVVGLIPLTYLKSQQALTNAKRMQADAQNLVKKTEKEVLGQSVSGSPLYQQWIDPFVDVYMNISKDDKANAERKEKLGEMMAVNFEESENRKISQNLESKELYDLRNDKNFLVAVYRVKYKIVTPVEKEREVVKDKKKIKEKYTVEETKEQSVLLNVPFKEFNGKFKVMALPYYTNEYDLTKGKVEQLPKEKNLDSVTNEESDEVDKFVSDFLKKYCNGNTKDMQYLMEKPESLSGYDLIDFKSEIKGKDKKYLVYMTVQFKDKETNFEHKEQISLLISRKDKTYFVDKMTHYLGGLLNE